MFYEDKNKTLRTEVTRLSSDQHYDQFKQQISKIRDSFTRSSKPEDLTYKPIAEEFNQMSNTQELLAKEKPVEFRDEEGYGKYLDLSINHYMYNNLSGIEPITYLKYLDIFDQLYDIPLMTKQHKKYSNYLVELKNYLMDFCQRAKPLVDCEIDKNDEIRETFETQWKSENFTGWSNAFLLKFCVKSVRSEELIDLDKYDNVEKIEQLGNEKLKLALEAMGLKCGGNLKEKAQRLFATKGKTLDQLDKSFFPKANKK